jgi:D-alanyl-D-alanine dipeptidase
MLVPSTFAEIDTPYSNLEAGHLPEGFVYLSNICPTIVQDIKYATKDNFTGAIVPGYNSNIAILTKEAAEAINLIQQELALQNLSLLIWDAYRPTQAVDFFLSWEKILDDNDIKAKYYPDYEKAELFKIGFIAPGHSSHSRGSTVDLTIINKETNKTFDMGTDFDFFGEKSYAESTQISEQAKENRKILKNIMEKYGFKGIPQEWWHYTFKTEPFPDEYFNFTVG